MGGIWLVAGQRGYWSVSARLRLRNRGSEKALNAGWAGFRAQLCCQSLDVASAAQRCLNLKSFVGDQNGSGKAVTVSESDVDLTGRVDDTGRAIDKGSAEAFPLPAHRFLRKSELSEPRLEVVRQSRAGQEGRVRKHSTGRHPHPRHATLKLLDQVLLITSLVGQVMTSSADTDGGRFESTKRKRVSMKRCPCSCSSISW
jgi:hypothetical protein